MDKLLNADTGLMIWTVVTFLLLLLVLTKAAWKPILDGLNAREGKIRSDLDRAEKSQKEAEALRLKFEAQLHEAQKTIQDMLAQAKADGERSKAQLIAAARVESEKILEKGRRDLADHVLARFDAEERAEVERMTARAADAAEMFVTSGIGMVMNRFNGGDPAVTE